MTNTKIGHFLLLFSAIVVFSGFPARLAADNLEGSTDDPWVAEDLSGKYFGRIYFGDKSGDQYIMNSRATWLEIKNQGTEFVLTDNITHKSVSGTIKTRYKKDNPDVRVGAITAQGDETIEIRWKKGARNRLQIVRASSVKRVFRFCTNNIKTAQCKIDL